MKRGVIVYIFLVALLFFNLLVTLTLFNFEAPLIGSAITTGSVALTILEKNTINVLSPLNTTYNFGIGENYTLDLNVSADFNVSSWWYTLLDLKHGTIIYENVAFSPNTTFDAVRWSNKLLVYANSSLGTISNKNVTFFIEVPNSAPVLEPINSSISICENEVLDYDFNVSDVDEDFLIVDISPKDPFYIDPKYSNGVSNFTSRAISVTLVKSYAGGPNGGSQTYEETISVSDGEYVDTANTNITVIEINNAPDVENIGVQTVWTSGDDSTFYKQVLVNDVEDGNQDSGNLTFNLTFFGGEDLFDINGSGVMNFTPNSSHIGVYNLSVCVEDQGLQNPHENISLCGQDGSSTITCNNFSLTVTDENRAPTITMYNPANLTLNVDGNDNLYFSISEYDPDLTIPDAYWYVDGSFEEFDSGSLDDDFTYPIQCRFSGAHTVKVEITDGLLNDSLEWNLNVDGSVCILPDYPDTGGGGGGGAVTCAEMWVCEEWNVCQNAEKSLLAGLLIGEDYRKIIENCSLLGLGVSACGMQIRKCTDLNFCNQTFYKPIEIQGCHYVEHPGCEDGIKNCHDGSCELLVDCGGPCKPCATCSDGIRNQGEEGIDCGGPCPKRCEIEEPWYKEIEVLPVGVTVGLIIAIILIIRKILKILQMKKKLIQPLV